MAHYLITTERSQGGAVASALDSVRDVVGVTVIDGQNPDMVLVEMSDEVADELRRKLTGTYFVDPETRHGLIGTATPIDVAMRGIGKAKRAKIMKL